MKSFLNQQHGNAAIMFSLSLPLLLGAAGAAVDYGRLSHRRVELQAIADRAAMAGAKVLSSSYGQTDGTRVSAATDESNAHARGAAPLASTSALVTLSTNSVNVKMSETLKLVFGGLLGQPRSAVAVSATAVYTTPPTCITALGTDVTTGIKVEGSASIQSPDCAVWSNTPTSTSVALDSSGSITAARVCAVGGGSGGTVKPTLEKYCQSVPDPFHGRNLISGVRPCDYTNHLVQASTTISPGVYCGGLKIQGSVTVSMSPGLYEIRGGPLHVQGNGAVVNGSGVSILLGSGAYLHYQGSPAVTVAAMTTGPLADLAIASDPATPAQTSTMHGNSTTVLSAKATGSIYLRNHTLALGGNADLNLNASPDLLAVRVLVVSGSAKVKSLTKLSTQPQVAMSQ